MSRDRPQTPGEALARTVAALMRRGKAFEDTVMKDPTGDSRRRGDAHGRGDSGLDRPGDRGGGGGGGGSLNFTGRNVDRFFLVGCSPYTFLQGTKSELLPPLTRDGYRLERDAYLKEQWDRLPQEEKDEYGFERETQDILQGCVDAQDERQRVEEAALKEAGSEEHEDGLIVDSTSGFTYARDATEEQIESLRSTKHHAAWTGLRQLLAMMAQQGLPQLGEEREGKVYGVRGGKVEGHAAEEAGRGKVYEPGREDAKQWETKRAEEGEARPEGGGGEREKEQRERERHPPYVSPLQRDGGDRGDRGDRGRGDRDRDREKDRGDRGGRSDRGDRGVRGGGDRGDRGDRDRDRERDRDRDRGRERERDQDQRDQDQR